MTVHALNRRYRGLSVCTVTFLAILSFSVVAFMQPAARAPLDAAAGEHANEEDFHQALRQVEEFVADLAEQEQRMKAGDAETITYSYSFLDPALVLATSGDPRAVLPLLELSKSVLDVGFFGSQAVGRLECDEKYPLLRRLLQNEKWWIRRNAALALGRSTVCDRATATALIEALGNESWQVRMIAAWALGRHQVRKAISGLEKLSHEQKGNRDGEEAARAIGAINGTPYKVQIGHQPLWFLVVDQDIPLNALGRGPIITFEGPSKGERFGYEYIESSAERPLKLSFARGQLFYYGSNGAVKVSGEDREVRVAGPYHPSVAPDNNNE